MRNLLLASAFLAAASFSRADDVVLSVAFDDAPALNAPLSGPAFIDPVFPVALDADRDEELEVLLDYVPSTRPNEESKLRTFGPDAFELLVVEAEVVR